MNRNLINYFPSQKKKEEELIADKNIFSLVVLASLYSLKSKNDDTQRLNFKIELTRLLLEKDYSTEKIKGLFKFINILLKLSDDLNKEIYYEDVRKMTVKDKKVELLSDYDEILIKKANKRKEEEIAKNMLKENIPVDVIAKVTGLSKEEIEKL